MHSIAIRTNNESKGTHHDIETLAYALHFTTALFKIMRKFIPPGSLHTNDMSHCSLEDKKSNEENKQDAQDGDTQYTINRFFGELENVAFEVYTKLLLNYFCVWIFYCLYYVK